LIVLLFLAKIVVRSLKRANEAPPFELNHGFDVLVRLADF
jgi:hypothetical protein